MDGFNSQHVYFYCYKPPLCCFTAFHSFPFSLYSLLRKLINLPCLNSRRRGGRQVPALEDSSGRDALFHSSTYKAKQRAEHGEPQRLKWAAVCAETGSLSCCLMSLTGALQPGTGVQVADSLQRGAMLTELWEDKTRVPAMTLRTLQRLKSERVFVVLDER